MQIFCIFTFIKNTDDKEGKGLYKKFLEKLDKGDNNFKSYKAIYENIKFVYFSIKSVFKKVAC